MATFKICIFKHQERSDGLFPVSIRVTWKQKSAYIKTEYYVNKKQITRDYEVKDVFILNELNARIAAYQDLKSHKLKRRIELFSAKELADYFVKQTTVTDEQTLDFIAFSEDIIRKTTNKSNAGLYQTVINSLKNYSKVDSLICLDIDLKFLKNYETWLLSKKQKNGKYVKGLEHSGVHIYMRTFKALFNRMRETYNDEEKGEMLIPFNPFKKYELPKIFDTEKRALSIELIRAIRDIELTRKRDIFSRDVFMLSFYLLGMNTVDMYECVKIEDGRITYNRVKTMGRRKDKALISVKVEPEAVDLIEKYKDKTGKRVFNFYQNYFVPGALNKAVNLGLKNIGKSDKINIPDLTFYSARHSFATIARNDCGISKYDIHEALNHSDPTMRVTDIYIKKDWSVIDNVARRVLDKIK